MWLGLLLDALELGVGLWLLVRVNQKLSAPRRRIATEFKIPWGLQVVLTGAALTALAYFVGFVMTPPSFSTSTHTGFFATVGFSFLKSGAATCVYVVPLATLVWLSIGPSKPGQGLYRGQFAEAEALYPLRVGPRESVPGDALLVGMVNQGTAERPRMELLARRPGFGGQRELGHALFVYPSRKGKGLQLTTQGLFWRHSLLFIDPKGEFFGPQIRFDRVLGDNKYTNEYYDLDTKQISKGGFGPPGRGGTPKPYVFKASADRRKVDLHPEK